MFGFFKKTSENIANFLGKKQQKISKETLEEILIESDVNYDIIEKMLENLNENVSKNELVVALERFFRGESYYDKVAFKMLDSKPLVFLIFGVNGVGKTTKIGRAHV